MKRFFYAFAAFLVLAGGVSAKPANLLEGALWQYSADEGKTFQATPPTLPEVGVVKVVARAEFPADPAGIASLDLIVPLAGKSSGVYALNGQTIEPPMAGMSYRRIPGVPATRLLRGANVLLAQLSLDAKATASSGGWPRIELTALRAEDIRVVVGPVLGMMDEGSWSVFVRTNLPASVEVVKAGDGKPVVVKDAVVESRSGLFHRVRIPRRAAPAALRLVAGDHAVTQPLSPPPAWPAGGAWVFAALGDSRDNAVAWGKIAAAVAAQNPRLVLHNGDFVGSGTVDHSWETDFAAPAAELLGRVPMYPAIGNHERNAPLYDEVFVTPGEGGRNRNWAQAVGEVLLIGIDGAQEWAPDSDNAKWLAGVLAPSRAKFILLMSHYPAWSSGRHGKAGADGKPAEKTVRQMQETVMPLLERCRATAMLAGHDHNYERSEPPGGVSMIVMGGAGAPLRPKGEGINNPHSKVFVQQHHYAFFTVEGDTLTMSVRTPEGEEIDRRAWEGRR